MAYGKYPDTDYIANPSTDYTAYPSTDYSAHPSTDYIAYPEGSSIVTPLTIISSVNVLQWCRGDLGHATADGGGVATWEDQAAAADYSQGTAGNRPTYTAADATLNNQSTLTFDGATDYMSASVTAGSGMFVWLILKQISWTATDRICGGVSGGLARMLLRQTTASPNMSILGTVGGPDNGGAAVGSWSRAEMHFSDSVNDFLKLGSTNVTGTDVNVANITVFEIGRCVGFNGNFALAEIVICDGLPSAGERTALDSYVTSRYGAGLT